MMQYASETNVSLAFFMLLIIIAFCEAEKINGKKMYKKFDFLNSVIIFAIGFAAFDDWETHQLYSENRDKFHSQWRATPSGSN